MKRIIKAIRRGMYRAIYPRAYDKYLFAYLKYKHALNLLNENSYQDNEALAEKAKEWLRHYSDEVVLAQRIAKFPNPEELFE